MFEYRPHAQHEREVILGVGPLSWIRLPVCEADEPLAAHGITVAQAMQALANLHGNGESINGLLFAAITDRPNVGTVLANRFYPRDIFPRPARAYESQED